MTDETLVPLTENVSGYDTLAIRVYHTKAGYGGFDWTYRAGGLKLSLSPCKIVKRDGFSTRESTMLSGDQWTSGFFLPLNEDSRKNPHKIKRIMQRVEERKESFAKAYSQKDIQSLQALASDVKE